MSVSRDFIYHYSPEGAGPKAPSTASAQAPQTASVP
jgi:hypothetical protein